MTDFKSLGFGTDRELIVNRLEYWTDKKGDKPLLYYGEQEETYTYREFNEQVNALAHNLMEQGIKKGDRISVFLRNQKVSMIAMFGIWKAGAIYSPINFNYMGRLLSYQINDTDPKMLITENQMIHVINKIAAEIEALPVIVHSPKETDHDYNADASSSELDPRFTTTVLDDLLTGNTQNPGVELTASDIANIVYTS